MPERTLILGGGVTGLAAGMASGAPVFEAAEAPGGICSSYYVRPGSGVRLPQPPEDGEAYRFEIGGGHWIFGGDPAVLRFIRRLTPVKQYRRRSAVYFRQQDLYVPYPLQNHLRYLEAATVSRALSEMARPPGAIRTMQDWQEQYFGPTLCALFFDRFQQRYTAGLYDRIAPQDAYKNPVDLAAAIQGALSQAATVGYNVTYVYPRDGLNALAGRMAAACDIHYGHRVVEIDPRAKMVRLADDREVAYDTLISTLPLHRMLELSGLHVPAAPDPYTSVLVLNIGAGRGAACPDEHWLYNPDARSGFHRVGFYSNVDRSFLPASSRQPGDRVSIYVERAYVGSSRPTAEETAQYAEAAVRELQEWGFIGEAEVIDPTWIDVAYTWAWPGSTWQQQALQALEAHDIVQVGRYARWVFQGIADSIRDGFYVGQSLKTPIAAEVAVP